MKTRLLELFSESVEAVLEPGVLDGEAQLGQTYVEQLLGR
jgi:hypothetical protein